jgi:hypothetical protein
MKSLVFPFIKKIFILSLISFNFNLQISGETLDTINKNIILVEKMIEAAKLNFDLQTSNQKSQTIKTNSTQPIDDFQTDFKNLMIERESLEKKKQELIAEQPKVDQASVTPSQTEQNAEAADSIVNQPNQQSSSRSSKSSQNSKTQLTTSEKKEDHNGVNQSHVSVIQNPMMNHYNYEESSSSPRQSIELSGSNQIFEKSIVNNYSNYYYIVGILAGILGLSILINNQKKVPQKLNKVN